MPDTRRLTAIIEREEGGYVSLCPELHIASQGSAIEEAGANLVEALTLVVRDGRSDRDPATSAFGAIEHRSEITPFAQAV